MSARFTPPAESTALHQPFDWLAPSLRNDAHAQFVALTRDVTRGVEVCLSIARSHNFDSQSESSTLLSGGDTENLMFLASRALQMLGDRAAEEIASMDIKVGEVKA